MADPAINIEQLVLNDQAATVKVVFTGPPDATGTSTLAIYDASQVEKWSLELYSEVLGTIWQHEANIDLPIGDLADGDYGLWVTATLNGPVPVDGYAGEPLADKAEGVSFLVGRGRAYRSGEAVHPLETGEFPVVIDAVRLEGTWVVIDMKNSAGHDVPVRHSISLMLNGTEVHTARGEELVNANVTQQAHHLLPESLADGSYLLVSIVQVEGVATASEVMTWFEVHDGAITVTP